MVPVSVEHYRYFYYYNLYLLRYGLNNFKSSKLKSRETKTLVRMMIDRGMDWLLEWKRGTGEG